MNGTIETTGKGIVNLYGTIIYGGAVTIGAGATVEAQQSSVLLDGVTVTDNGALLATLSTTLTLENTTINATISETKGVITGGLIEESNFLFVPATIVLSGAIERRGDRDSEQHRQHA